MVFTLHPDFPDPIRTVKVPPFEVSETGYAGFSIPITITFSCHKKITIVYDMNLTMGESLKEGRLFSSQFPRIAT